MWLVLGSWVGVVVLRGGVKIYRGSAAGARVYLEAGRARSDDYYLGEGNGFATHLSASPGRPVELLGLLSGDGYESWVAGVDPVTGESRGRLRRDESGVRFAEVVVNGPKSWSLVAELHPDIAAALEGAQDRAAEQIVGWFAEHATTRVGPRGGQVSTPVERLEAVSVRHYTNRAGDPHRHLHVQVNARVLAAGKWRGIDTVAVRDSIAAVHGVGHAAVVTDPAFRAALSAHGFTLNPDGEVRELVPFVGAFSQRAEQITRQAAGYETQWRAANPGEEPGPKLRRSWDARAWAERRPDKGVAEPAGAARDRWVSELYRLGFQDPPPPGRPGPNLGPDLGPTQGPTRGPDRGPGTPAVSPALEPADLAPAQVGLGGVEVAAAAAEVVARLGMGRSAWNLPDLRGEAEQLIARTLVVAEAGERARLAEEITVAAAGLCRPLLNRAGVPGHVRALTSEQVLTVQDDMEGRMAVRGAFGGTAVDPARVQAVAAASGLVLDVGQAGAVAALAGDNPLVMVHGAAGAGKTTTLATARDVLAQSGQAMVVVTPTLKAAKVAARELTATSTSDTSAGDGGPVAASPGAGAEATLGSATPAVTSSAAALVWAHGWRWDERGWSRLAEGQLDPTTGRVWSGPTERALAVLGRGDLLVVDEAGMLDQDTARALLVIADEVGARVALVGDPHQLPAVGRGGVLDAGTRWASSVSDLTVVHRFTRTVTGQDGVLTSVPDTEYAEASLRLRRGQDPGGVFDALARRGWVHRHTSETDQVGAVAAQVVADRVAGVRTAVVVDTVEAAREVSTIIREHLVTAGLVDDAAVVTTTAGVRIGVGDTVVTRRNDHQVGVANRDQWQVTGITDTGGLQLSGPAGAPGKPAERTVGPGYVAERVELGYASTVYGVQGDTVPSAHLLLSERTSAAGAYVGLTRGRTGNHLHLVAADDTAGRGQFIDAFGRGRADLGVPAAREAAQRAAAPYATPPTTIPASTRPAATLPPPTAPVRVSEEELAVVLAELRGAWWARRDAELQLARLAPLLTTARGAAAARDAAEVALAPLRNAAAEAAGRAASGQAAAAAAQRVLDTRANELFGQLHSQWDAERPQAIEAARTVTAGPGRFGVHRGDVRRAQNWLDGWAADWAPILPELTGPAAALRVARDQPVMDRVDASFTAYVKAQVAQEKPAQVAVLRAARTAEQAEQAAAQVLRAAQDQARTQALTHAAYTGWRAGADQLPHLTETARQAQQRRDTADADITRISAHPAVTDRPDAQEFLDRLFTRWQHEHTAQRAAANAAAYAEHQAQQQHANQHHQPIASPSPSHGRNGPSFGR